jgi:transposase, IS5 family
MKLLDSLFAAEERVRKLDRLGEPLAALSAHVDFDVLAERVSAKLPEVDRSRGGRPPFPVTLMVKLLVLKQLYNLSDDQVEYQALDRASFQRFLGAEAVIAAEVQRQLGAAGYIARGGQLIDASIVRAPVQHFTSAEREVLERGETPEAWSPAKRAQKDLDARWTKKHGKSYHGYKVHVSVDVKQKLIRAAVVTPASVHDTNHFEDLLDPCNTSRTVSADKGYVDGAREDRLKARGWRPQIQRRAKAGQPLGKRDAGRNQRIAKTRARVEHVFAGLQQMGTLTVRTIGLARAKFQMSLKVSVYNLKRLLWLSRAQALAA